jgi:hypothetical protein
MRSAMPERPADECPYRKPFGSEFEDCPSYQQTQFVPLDTQYRPLDSVWTCGNLDIGRVGGSPWRHFGRCRIGSAESRMAWVGRMREDRLAVTRAMQRELAPLMADQVTALWGLKGRQLAAPAGSQDHATATAELMRQGNAFLLFFERWFEEHDDVMRRLNLPIGATMELFREIVYAWIDQPNAEIPTISPEALERFPEEARILLMPESAA